MTTMVEPRERTLSSAPAAHFEGVWVEHITQKDQEVVFERPIPVEVLRRYAREAAKHATHTRLEDGSFYASVNGFDGVWTNEATLLEALTTLEEVVFEWAVLKIADGDRDLPVLGDIDLNAL